MPACAACADPATSACGRCRFATYCGTACQTAHWPTHKPVCVAIAADAALMEFAVAPNFHPRPLKCHACSVPFTTGCSMCEICFYGAYCTDTCQVAHWPTHQLVCSSVKAAKEIRQRAKAEEAEQKNAREEAEAARKLALRRAHVSLDVGRSSAIEIVRALRDFPEDAGLAEKSLRAFVARNDVESAIDSGLLVAIVMAMRTHVGDVDHETGVRRCSTSHRLPLISKPRSTRMQSRPLSRPCACMWVMLALHDAVVRR